MGEDSEDSVTRRMPLDFIQRFHGYNVDALIVGHDVVWSVEVDAVDAVEHDELPEYRDRHCFRLPEASR